MPLAEAAFGLLPVLEVDDALLAAFRCGKDHLDAFLAGSSKAFAESRIGLTTVVFHEDLPRQIVGYFTLANDAVPLNATEQFEYGLAELPLESYPAVKLGRLAVADALQGQGIGAQVMSLVHGEVLDSTSLSAARLVVLDADATDPRVPAFYRKLGYQDSLWAQAKAKNHAAKRAGPAKTIKMVRDVLAP